MYQRTMLSCAARQFFRSFAAIALLVLWSSASNAYSNQWEWTAKIFGYNVATPSNPLADCVQPAGNFPSKAAALAAAYAACDPNTALLKPPPTRLTKQAGVTTLNSSTTTYRYVLPASQPIVGEWLYDPINAPDYSIVGRYPDEASYYEALTRPINELEPREFTLESDWACPPTNTTCQLPGLHYEFKSYRFSPCLGYCFITLTRLKLSHCEYGYTQVGDANQDIVACIPNPNLYIEVYGHPLTCSKTVGDPCDVATGDNQITDTDYSRHDLFFTRYYHSISDAGVDNLGSGWSHNYNTRLVIRDSRPTGLIRGAGFQESLRFNGSYYVSEMASGIKIRQVGSQWVAFNPNGKQEAYDVTTGVLLSINDRGRITTLQYSNNLITSITGPFGHVIQLNYDEGSRLAGLVDPDGKTIRYGYNDDGSLSQVIYQDGNTRSYVYENPQLPGSITGIIDENGSRLSTFEYDSSGRVIQSQEADGANRVQLSYAATSTTVVDALGATSIYQFTDDAHSRRLVSTTIDGKTRSVAIPSYENDFQRRVTSHTDANGNSTYLSYDAYHLVAKTEAVGSSAERTTYYQYLNNDSDLPTLITEPSRITSYTYDAQGNPLTKSITDSITGVSRTWSYTYNSYSQVLTVDGPRTDVNDLTTYTYYTCVAGLQCGQLQTVTNALGQVTTYDSYNAHGQPLSITDPNGVITTLTYDTRQRLTSRDIAGEQTSFTYYPTGLLKQVTLPDNSYLAYGYDAAHRLIQIQDADGNKVAYALDAAGNRIAENYYDPSGALSRTHSKVFNWLGQLYQDMKAANTADVATTYSYDGNGNQLTISAPMGRAITNQYDALNRLSQAIGPTGGVTTYDYDSDNNLSQVTDPRGLVTGYAYNGLGDLLQINSPDTGTTVYTRDSAGNLKSRTDARSKNATYEYDALNRLTQIVYPDQVINYTFDQNANGKGRLTEAGNASQSLSYGYDALGRVVSKTQVIGGQSKTVSYVYGNGLLSQLTTPSGQIISYGYSNGKLTSIAVNDRPVVHEVLYAPSGQTEGWRWGEGALTVRQYDQDGQLTTIDSAGLSTYTFNPDGSIATKQDDNSGSVGISTGLTTFTVADSNNRLSTATGELNLTNRFDKAGNVLRSGVKTFTYDDAGRLSTATRSGLTTNYLYNALGQRIQKSNLNGTTQFIYDEHGHLLGEYDQSGNLVQELVWLNNIPVATIITDQGGGTVGVFYVHTDHLNSPTKITRPSDNAVIWRWDRDPYGNGVPNEDPDGNGLTLTMNLRFPGQYSDSETGLYYNYFRYYDPQSGRYLQSDPIGLTGGSFSTYSYVGGNPIAFIDPYGLAIICNDWKQYMPPQTFDELTKRRTYLGEYSWLEAKLAGLDLGLNASPRSPFPDGPRPSFTFDYFTAKYLAWEVQPYQQYWDVLKLSRICVETYEECGQTKTRSWVDYDQKVEWRPDLYRDVGETYIEFDTVWRSNSTSISFP